MYFKRLELFGFKSFADKTRLDFEPGITAVVGPNGCGKSNIADAIKWVLGEQSAKMMRGGKMEDVIFNGTDGKEPVSYAEVSLTLANQDRVLPIEYDEVTVSRRLYRSGESEYLLNKTPVRLRDINELFMGTGIGTSAYSLIEQGRIDQILSSKPEDRREVFEEASGITKYKSKRKEALRRLEGTEQNLLRINDIIAEVKRQINSIERQARKAERYKEKYEELKKLELKLSRIDLEMLNQKLSESNANLDERRAREVELNSELQKLTVNLSELNTKRAEVEDRRLEFKSSIIEIDFNISKSKDKLLLNRERIDELKNKRVDLKAEIEKSEGSIDSQEREVASLREKVTVLASEGIERADLLSKKEKRLQEISKDILKHETNISTSKANVIDVVSKTSKLRNQIAQITTNLSTHDARLIRLETEIETLREEKDSLETKLEEVRAEAGSVEKEIELLKKKRREVSLMISDMTSRIEELIERSKDTHKSLATNKSRLEILEEAKAKYEGFSSGVRSILGSSGENPHAIGGMQDVLVNLLNVKQGYEIAIETALGENLQSIVVDTMEAAENAIGFLKENSCGKASFIHPESFDRINRDKKEIDLRSELVLGKAIEFVSIDGRYANTLKNLLKNIFIVRDLENAKEILRSESDSIGCRFVTVGGETVGNGFIAGGNITEKDTTLINRDARIKELSEVILKLEADLEQAEEERLKDEEVKEESGKALEDITTSLSEKEIFFANAKSRSANIEENLKGVVDEVSLMDLEISEVSDEIERFRSEEVKVKEELSKAEEDARLNEEAIQYSENLISEYAKEKEKLLIETAEQRTELGALEGKKESFSNTLTILESSLNDAQLASGSRKTEIENSIKKVDELTKEIFCLEEDILTLSGRSAQKANELGSIEKGYSDITGEIKSVGGIFRDSEKEVNELRAMLHEVDLKKAETNYSVDNLMQRMRDVYKLDLNTVEIASDWQEVDVEPIKVEVEEKRAKLDSMGTVNLVAIEEHTELQDRHAFLTNQRDDLLNAKDSLLKAIAKINKTTKDLFMETFKNIQVEFRNFFKMLFGGGEGELILMDEGNILESGIEIVAKPPGKRLQNVSLLSGGEKALTAISLIFAIFKVKPSPFCVLDEIDAPLDESNVGRFSRSLEMFTHTSQFIVITHNKKTIDMADVMYGITMQESGVSKVVSVKFSDAKKQESVKVE
ncbi:chromosome segregation protein SMC [Candidatus Omnitrophota bacterium]